MIEMKYSGEEWINDIPGDWLISKIGTLYSVRNTKVSDRDYQPLSVTMKGVLPQLETAAKTDAHDDRKLVKKGDFAINSRSDRRGACGIAESDGSVSLINTILCPRNEMDPKYYNWLFHTSQFADEYYRWGHGIVDDLWTTRWQEMKNISIPVPSLLEQKAIATFLDNRISKIDSLIANQEQQIGKLKQYKQSLITEVVTKGLDRNVAMKDSGVKTIGKIPVNWQIVKFKNVAKIANGREIDIDGGHIPVYGSGGVFKYTNKPLFSGISLLMGRKGTIDNPMLVDGDFWTVDTMFYTSEIKNMNPKYLLYSCKGLIDYEFYKSGSVLPSMTQTDINQIPLTYPPMQQQELLVDYLDRKCSTISKLIDEKEAKIDKLNQYKKSLIYEYVTGKKRVLLYD